MLPRMEPRRHSHPGLRVSLPAAAFVMLCAAGFAASVAAQTVSLTTGSKQVRIDVGAAAALPADFPADVVLPQPHVLVRVQRSLDDTILEFDLAGDVDAAAAEVQSAMLANDWTAAPVAQPAAGRAQAWEKDARAVIAWLRPGADGTRLHLQLKPHR